MKTDFHDERQGGRKEVLEVLGRKKKVLRSTDELKPKTCQNEKGLLVPILWIFSFFFPGTNLFLPKSVKVSPDGKAEEKASIILRNTLGSNKTKETKKLKENKTKNMSS
ncbi:hypothetical protein NPIL_517891 [Nephila pilipes]|uniref:Uncharacterized protein n=1 Tax=Nephila pilipes TaxID=299642 RepID=A0A8X6NUL4_NEPPI|nr:hypothetical protein NPIL_517891 [Nephila pilipes]